MLKANDFRTHRAALEARGAVFPEVERYLEPQFRNNSIAFDAQPILSTSPNAGIPGFLANYLDPEIITVLFAPMMAAVIYGEEKRGDWVTRTMMFPVIEYTAQVSSYGDYNTNGSSGANVNWPARQSYHYQVESSFGERELDQMALAKIGWANEKKKAAILGLNKYQNLTYFFGVAGLQNYGGLNDPSLSAAITPATKAAGGTSWSNATAGEVFNDIKALIGQLIAQSDGIVDGIRPTEKSSLVLAMHPTSALYMHNLNPPYDSTDVFRLVTNAFPNIRIETAVEYLSPSGVYSCQLIAENLDGSRTTFCAYTEKLRAHTVVRDTSSYHQKMSQGTWGTIIRRPFAIASMAGI